MKCHKKFPPDIYKVHIDKALSQITVCKIYSNHKFWMMRQEENIPLSCAGVTKRAAILIIFGDLDNTFDLSSGVIVRCHPKRLPYPLRTQLRMWLLTVSISSWLAQAISCSSSFLLYTVGIGEKMEYFLINISTLS